VTPEDEWLWGWDPTPGIVSVWADAAGRATFWRRVDGALVCERTRFRPWVLTADDAPFARLGDRVDVRQLSGDGALRYRVEADELGTLTRALRRDAPHLVLPPEEQYLVATGRTYFRDLAFDAPAPTAVRPRDHRARRRTTASSSSRCATSRGSRRPSSARRCTDADEAELIRARGPRCAPPIPT
jgi:hypothetical protein